jgi:hypothetical protein
MFLSSTSENQIFDQRPAARATALQSSGDIQRATPSDLQRVRLRLLCARADGKAMIFFKEWHCCGSCASSWGIILSGLKALSFPAVVTAENRNMPRK